MRHTFIRTLLLAALAGVTMITLGCQTQNPAQAPQAQAPEPNWTYQPGPVSQLPVMDFARTIQKDDHIVFIGDEMTQQMFYTRAVATGLLALRPGEAQRIYNAGNAGATAADTITWAPDVLKLTQASVVFVALGLNDALATPDEGLSMTETYKKNMAALVDVIRETKTVRQIILIGPPAVQSGLTAELASDSYNAKLIYLSEQAQAVAQEKEIGYIDLFIHTSAVYLGQMQVGGEPLTLGGKLPSEDGHVIIASVILRGIGVTGEQLDAVAFCPLMPGRMGRIRPALAVKTTIPDPEAAAASRGLYLTLARYDEAFFMQWRLARRDRLLRSPEDAAAQVELTWGNVQRQAQELQLVLQGPSTSQ